MARRRPDGSAGRNVIGKLFQAGSSRLLFARAQGRALESILLNTAGGVTGGDEFSCTLTAGAGSTLTLTTQACERAYRAAPGERARLKNTLRIEAGARINWLPQETILYDRCALERSLSVDLAQDARLLAAETLVFGRSAMGEVLGQALLRDRIEIRRAGAPLYLDAIALSGDVESHLARAAIADGARAMTSLVYVAGDARAMLARVRALLPARAGASLIGEDVLVLRLLAQDSHALRRNLLPVLDLLNDDPTPRCWTI